MSRKIRPGFKDVKGIIETGFDGNAILSEGTTVPTDATTGYAPGGIFFKRSSTAGGQFYINEGTAASCAFKALNSIQPSASRIVNCTAASLTVSPSLHDGKIVTLNAATGIAVALPVALGTGAWYRFYIGTTITTTNVTTFTAAGSDKLYGQVYQLADGGSTLAAYELPASTIITLGTNANTTGGTRGDTLEFIDIGAAEWWCVAHTTAAGTEATPVT